MLRDRVIEIFVKVDGFCIEIQPILEEKLLKDRKLGKRNRKAGLGESEMISLMVLFHSGQFSNLKSFYVHYTLPHLKDLFPGLTSYNRLVDLQPRCALAFMLFVKICFVGKSGDINFIDSSISRCATTEGCTKIKFSEILLNGVSVPSVGSKVLNYT